MTKVSTTKKPRKKVRVASNKRGLSGIEDVKKETIVGAGVPLLIFVGKIVVVGIGLKLVYNAFTNRFIKLKENSNYPVSNITTAQAQTRADAIIGSIGSISNSFDTVASNMAGLNYNGFVRLYNAFGEQRGTLLAGKLNLIEWIKNQFSEDEVQQLSFLTNGVFF